MGEPRGWLTDGFEFTQYRGGDQAVDEEETTTLERNKRLVIEHFDAFVNKKDLGAIDRNMAADFLDHDGPGGKQADREGDRR